MNPVLYILVRTDLPSMNSGKAMAQAAHAGTAFYHKANKLKTDLTMGKFADQDEYLESLRPHLGGFDIWRHSTPQGFGTKLTLAVTENEMLNTVKAMKDFGYFADIINDPTYPYIVTNEIAKMIPIEADTTPRHPVSDTHMALYRSENTVGYVFVPDKDNDTFAGAMLGHFNLHP